LTWRRCLSGEDCRGRGRSGTFHDQPLLECQPLHRASQLVFADRHHAVRQPLHQRERHRITFEIADQAVGERWTRCDLGNASGLQAVRERRGGLDLHADDRDVRRHGPQRQPHAAGEPAAAKRNHRHIEQRHRLDHLERHGAGPGNHIRVVVGRHVDTAFAVGERTCLTLRGVVIGAL
jgi:hypothetical protein